MKLCYTIIEKSFRFGNGKYPNQLNIQNWRLAILNLKEYFMKKFMKR
jgi:hypothetical protein